MATSRNTAVFELRTETGDSVNDIKKMDQSLRDLEKTTKKTQTTMSDSKGTDKFEKELQELNRQIDSGELNFQQMTRAIKDYQTIAFRAGATSPVGAKAIQQASDLRDRLADLDARTRQLSSDYAKMDAVIQGATGAMAGFTAFQGVATLIGDENEDLLKTITKLQGATSALTALQQLRLAVNKDSALVQQVQILRTKILAKETLAQATATKLATLATQEGTKAFKVLRGAILATGIGALVVGVTLLIQNFDKLRDMITGSSDDQRALNATMEDYKKGAEDAILQTNKVETAFKLAKDGVISKEEALRTYNEELGDAFGKTKDLEEAERLFNEKADAYVEAMAKRAQANALFAKSAELSAQSATAEFEDNRSFLDKWGSSLLKTYGFISAGEEKATQDQIDATAERQKLLDEQSEAILKLGQDKLKEAEETEEANNIKGESDQKYAEEARKRREKEAQDLLKLRQQQAQQLNSLLDQIAQEEEDYQTSARQKEINAVTDHYFELITKAEEYGQDVTILTEARDAKVFAIEEKYRKMTQDAIDKANQLRMNEEEELDELIYQAGLSAREKELSNLNDYYFEKITRAEEFGIDTSALLAEQKKKEAEIEEKYRKEQEQKDQESLQKRGALYTAHLDTLSGGLESLNNLNDLVTTIQMERAEGNEAKQEAIQKKSFERNKKIQIALATIQGIQGVINALTAASVLPEPFGSIQKAVQATVVATATASNIAKIKATKFQGGGSVSAGGGGGVQGASASSFSIGDDTSSAQTMLNPDGTQSQSGNGQAVQVFVTETDISNVQQNVQQIDVRSTF
jgi:hypothetical protein